jgi:hypothetical protein
MRGPASFPYLGGGAPRLSDTPSAVHHVARSLGDDLGVRDHELGGRLAVGDTLVTITVSTGDIQGPPPIAQIIAVAKTAAAHLNA